MPKYASFEPLQRNTEELRKNITEFVDQVGSDAPQLNKLLAFVNKLADGEYFYIFPNVHLDALSIMDLSNRLVAFNKDMDLALVQDQFAGLFGDILANYDMLSFNGGSKAQVGERDKSKRRCRFCKRGMPEVRFANKSHAISEALGNKAIICLEECDECNSGFGKGIETDLIAFLSLYRAYFGTKGKGSGAPELKGRNFSVQKGGDGKVNFSVIGDADGFPERIEMHTYEKIVPQNVYRALCKFALSVVDAEILPSLSECVEWVRGNKGLDDVSPVKMKIINSMFSEFPSLSIYVRKNTNYSLPHVIGEFRFASIVIVFVLPLSRADRERFSNTESLEPFWDISHFSKDTSEPGWSTLMLKSNVKSELRFLTKFEKSDDRNAAP